MADRTCTFYDKRHRLRCTECGLTLELCLCGNHDELAQARIQSEAGKFLADVHSALLNLPLQEKTHLYFRIMEQLGNAGAQLTQHEAHRTPPPIDIYQTFVRLSAYAALFATEGTPELAYPAT